MMEAVRIKAGGVVQGVGFRPFVYRLAHEHKLAGWVRNTSGNVEIALEGKATAVRDFVLELRTKTPPQARIEFIETEHAELEGFTEFVIRESRRQTGQYQLVSPDIATCADCLREILDPADRRHNYPFTNCTNCGPRFTIIEDIPYDRPLTTMRRFQMCPACQTEYDNPLDRRFHAQPNACPVCGPRLELLAPGGTPVSGEAIPEAARLLREGKILALRGLGGFQLAVDATNENAVKRLRERKHRPGKPFAVTVTDLEGARHHAYVSQAEGKLLTSPESPIVLLRWRRDTSDVTPEVAPNLKYLGLMLPYTPLHHLLLREAGRPLVMTSGNLSEEPIAKDNDEAIRRLGNIADYFLLHNRDIYARYDDSVYMVVDEQSQPLRRARGYAPYPIPLDFATRQVLACGAEEKNTFCLTKDDHAFLSQHIGDMENEETLTHFENTIQLYEKLFRITPEIIAADMHPDYLATKYAQELSAREGLRLVTVQHHHAHIASCLADNHRAGPVIGVAFDGTGYGSDGAIWGGEFLIADYRGFERAGHLEYLPLVGGAAAIKKPARLAAGYLYHLLGDNVTLTGLPLRGLNLEESEIIKQQLERGINTPLTSSAGRLFDAVSALAGIRGSIDYEAQAAIELEMAAPDDGISEEAYPFTIEISEGGKIVMLRGLLETVASNVRAGAAPAVISQRFHHTMAGIITKMCYEIREATGLDTVALSGGVFQNRLLLKLTTTSLAAAGFEVLTHRRVPCNDGGLALGQAVIANFA